MLQGRIFYQPSNQGYESSIKNKVKRNREAQLSEFDFQSEVDQYYNTNYRASQTMSSLGELHNEIRENLVKLSTLTKDTFALMINAGDALLLSEFLRHITEEKLYMLVDSEQEKQNLSTLLKKKSIINLL